LGLKLKCPYWSVRTENLPPPPLPKAPFSFVMFTSICLHVRTGQLQNDFSWNFVFVSFIKIYKFHIWSESDNNNLRFKRRPFFCAHLDPNSLIFIGAKNISKLKLCREMTRLLPNTPFPQILLSRY
jgi:hypothetical protein